MWLRATKTTVAVAVILAAATVTTVAHSEVTYAYGGPNNDQQSITKGVEFTETWEREASRK